MRQRTNQKNARVEGGRNDIAPPDPFINLVAEVFRIHRRIRTLFAESTELTGLTRVQNSLLMTVIESENKHTIAQFARSLGYPRQVVQRTANELIGRDLLATEENPFDKRARFVVATEAGREVKSKADEWANAISVALLGDIDEGLCERICCDLKKLREIMDRHSDRKNL